jgi:hypothetical protein
VVRVSTGCDSGRVGSVSRSHPFHPQSAYSQFSIAFDLTVAERICYKNMRVFVGFYPGDDAQNIPQ